jgi:hypothetical protein
MSIRTILPLETVMSKALRCLVFGALLTLYATHAKADALTLIITNPTQTITYGQLDQFGVAQVTFIGNLSNTANQQITIGTPGQPFGDPFSYHVEITQQSTQLGIVYNPQFPTTVAALTNLNGLTLFTINVPLFTNVPAHTITATFTVHYYLPGGDVQIASGNITINVPPGISAPEPATLALFATGIGGVILRKRKRRRFGSTVS